VFLIGAGPGDPGLITVRGLECLRGADVVVYDHLVQRRLLAYARPGAELIDVGSASPRGIQEEEAISYLLADKAREGKLVARLKWGDPFVFDRGGEEALYLHEQGVPFEVVPGVPAGIGVPTYAGVPVTYPGGGDTLTLIRGYEDEGRTLPRRRSLAEALARDLSSSLGAYFAGLTTIVFARIVATGAFLAIARVPFVIALALLAGASVLIPYLGSVLRLAAIGAVAWESRGAGGALEALAFVAAYDLVENYVVSPLVYRKALGISALWQLLAVLFFGYHFGVVGAVLAIPLAATVQIVSRALLSPATDPAAPPARPSGRLLGPDRVAHGSTPEAPANPRSGG
jgi:precorrin-4 methylase